ncbi:hypothetical protein FRC08_010054, partial [Ceratobasidium sp. 394]
MPETARSSHQSQDNVISPTIRAKYTDLEQKMCEKFGWTEAKRFQVDGGICQMEGVNLLVHVGTGSGKTAVAAAPFALPQNQKKITIFVSPLMALETEM